MKKSVFIILIVLFAAIHLKAQSSIAPSVFNASGGSNVVVK